jgi:pimeloyl-ACP methyl ester carboxylesterase
MKVLRLAAALLCLAPLLSTQEASARGLEGTWQGRTGKQQRVLRISRTPGGYQGELYTLGEDPRPNPASKIDVRAGDVSFDLDYVAGHFAGRLTSDGNALAGTWEARGPAQPVTFVRASGKDAWVIDASPHTSRSVQVDKDVRLDVLDWGGDGPPLIFLAGMGNSAHVFDTLAPKFTTGHHVYGITRRGFTPSSVPAPSDENYDADRLGDDVLAVIRALTLDHPVVVGHSVAGEELSSIGTRHPEMVRGLIYLDAAFAYAYYDPNGERRLDVEASDLRRRLRAVGLTLKDPSLLRGLSDSIQTAITQLQPALQEWLSATAQIPPSPPMKPVPQDAVVDAILANERKYGAVGVPRLVIAAVPHQCAPYCGTPYTRIDDAATAAQADVLASAALTTVVRLPNADHYVWHSNESEVVRAMNAFLARLEKTASVSGP